MLHREAVSAELLDRVTTLQKNSLFNDYYLAGGTALALQTGFRNSIDIDLFTYKKQDNELLLNFFYNSFKEVRIDNKIPGILNLTIDGIKTDVCNVRGKIIETPITDEGVSMFELKDISAMKLSAICGRKRAKDYIDIAYLLSFYFSIEDMFDLYKKKYDENDIFIVKKALLEYNKVNPYEWEKVNILDKKFFVSNVPSIIKSHLEEYNRAHKIGIRKIFPLKIWRKKS